MQHNPKTYSSIGMVNFPVHDPQYENLAETSPADAGVLVVRLLVEDQSTHGRRRMGAGPTPTHDDFLVGCDKFQTAKEAHEYFARDRRIVENILLGAIDWSGTKRLPGEEKPSNVVEFFRATRQDLHEEAQAKYDEIEATHVDCGLFLVTALDRDTATIDLLMRECVERGLEVHNIPKTAPSVILCGVCRKVKPRTGSKRLGWKKIGKQNWACAEHAEPLRLAP